MLSPIKKSPGIPSPFHRKPKTKCTDMEIECSGLSSRRDDHLSQEVAFARNYYWETWRKSRNKPWDCTIQLKYPNPDWTFQDGLSHHSNTPSSSFDAQADVDLAPEEVIGEDGEIHQAEEWLEAHPNIEPSSPKRWEKTKARLVVFKNASRRRLSAVSAISHSSYSSKNASDESIRSKAGPGRIDSGFSGN